MWIQRALRLEARPRGVHLITRDVLDALPEVGEMRTGMLNVFIRHTSASLALNENASPDVRRDLDAWLDDAVREDAPYWTHVSEGPDDMPAHVKSIIVGPSLMVPVAGGRPALGTWQGIYLLEHRDHGGAREIVLTAWGEPA
ncbi:MAG: secondary thiamine-phosphate synthase enzyme YjbQ [Acidobacteria bacterium]|nr:secondary thiamine-phosphate synthase enzyme YjbQ [Acidobacteriota bacterium]